MDLSGLGAAEIAIGAVVVACLVYIIFGKSVHD